MTEPAKLQRLDRLEAFLRQDPQNAELLADTFDTALQAGAWERADFHLQHGLALGLDGAAWRLRQAHWLLGQHRWVEARARLTDLEHDVASSSPHADTVVADLAYLDLRQGDLAGGIRRLETRMDELPGRGSEPALEQVWLRLLHRDLQLERALAWLSRLEQDGQLQPATAGVGSLIAFDEGDYTTALRWSAFSLGTPPSPIEALVARASLALGESDPSRSRHLLQAALALNHGDGRVWSTIGFTELLDQRLPEARAAFDRAVVLMPEHVGTWHGLGWTALAQRDFAVAREAFVSALALDRNFAESHGSHAVALALSGDAEGARGAIAVALRLDRASLAARYAEALISGEARDSASLLRLADRLLMGKRTPLGSDLVGLLRNRRN